MKNTQSLLFYLLIDYSLHLFKVPLDERSKLLSFILEKVPFTFYHDCQQIKDGNNNYFNFTSKLQEFSKLLHKNLSADEIKHNICLETGFYLNRKGLIRLVKEEFDESLTYLIYSHISYISLIFNRYPKALIESLNIIEKEIEISPESAHEIRVSNLKLLGFLDHEDEELTQSQKMMALLMAASCLLVSDNIIDKQEQEALAQLASDINYKTPNHQAWTSFFKYSSNRYNNKIAEDLDRAEKERIITLIHRVIASDGNIDITEKKLLAKYFINFKLNTKDINFIKSNKKLSIPIILSEMKTENIFYTLNLCLEMTLADGIIKEDELEVLSEIYQFIDSHSFEAVNLDGTYIQFLEFVLLNAKGCNRYKKIISSYEKKYHEISSGPIASDYYSSVIFNMLCTHRKDDIDLSQVLDLISMFKMNKERSIKLKLNIIRTHAGSIIVETLYYAVLSIQMIINNSLSDEFHLEIKHLYNKISNELENKQLSKTMIYLMFKMLLIDDKIDTLEGTFLDKIFEEFKIEYSLKKKYLFVTSYEQGKHTIL